MGKLLLTDSARIDMWHVSARLRGLRVVVVPDFSACRHFSRGVIFTRARVSLALYYPWEKMGATRSLWYLPVNELSQYVTIRSTGSRNEVRQEPIAHCLSTVRNWLDSWPQKVQSATVRWILTNTYPLDSYLSLVDSVIYLAFEQPGHRLWSTYAIYGHIPLSCLSYHSTLRVTVFHCGYYKQVYRHFSFFPNPEIIKKCFRWTEATFHWSILESCRGVYTEIGGLDWTEKRRFLAAVSLNQWLFLWWRYCWKLSITTFKMFQRI